MASIIEQLKQEVKKHYGGRAVELAKFSQRIAHPHTKALFLASVDNKPVCVIKTVRSNRCEESLRKEASVQKHLQAQGSTIAPWVQFETGLQNKFFYAEEIVHGEIISKEHVQAMLDEILHSLQSLPVTGEVQVARVAGLFGNVQGSDKDIIFQDHISALRSLPGKVKTGLTHSDPGRVNMILSKGQVRFIDWERAGERPFWMIDAVYILVKVLKMRSLDEWVKGTETKLIEHTGYAQDQVRALYHIHMLFEITKRKYPNAYAVLVKDMASL